MAAGHLQFQILDSDRENSLFYSPIPLDAKHILDIGTGDANWAIDVADEMPDSALSLPSRVSLSRGFSVLLDLTFCQQLYTVSIFFLLHQSLSRQTVFSKWMTLLLVFQLC